MVQIENYFDKLISGEDLCKLYIEKKFSSRLKDILPSSPVESMLKIAKYYNVIPSSSGHNIIGIVNLRDLLYSMNLTKQYENAFVITAPHTHWENNYPIIFEKLNEATYLVGQKKPNEKENYFPVSFILNDGNIIPYEWASESINIDYVDVFESIKIIRELSAGSGINNILGISLNFRFKKLFDNATISNIENPVEFKISNYDELSVIEQVLIPSDSGIQSQQVSWHMYSDLKYDLTESERSVLNAIRNLSVCH